MVAGGRGNGEGLAGPLIDHHTAGRIYRAIGSGAGGDSVGGHRCGCLHTRKEGVIIACVGCLVGACGGGEVRRVCLPGDVEVPCTVHCNTISPIIKAGSPEVGAVDRGSAGVKLGYEGVIPACVSCLVGACGGGEVRRICISGDVDVTCTVHCNTISPIIKAGSPEVGAVDQGSAGVKLGYEGVIPACVGCLVGACGGGEVRRRCISGDVDVSCAVHCNTVSRIISAGPPKVGAVDRGSAGVKLGYEGVTRAYLVVW